MSWFQREIQLPSFARGFHPITHIVLDAVPEIAQIRTGLFHVFLKHTSASLLINENADPDVLTDMSRVLDTLAPQDFPYQHTAEGPTDMPGHVKSALLGCSLTVPIHDGRLCLGNWQGICLCEHRRRAGRRRIVVTIQGEAKSRQSPVIHLPSAEHTDADDRGKMKALPPNVIHLPAGQPPHADDHGDTE